VSGMNSERLRRLLTAKSADEDKRLEEEWYAEDVDEFYEREGRLPMYEVLRRLDHGEEVGEDDVRRLVAYLIEGLNKASKEIDAHEKAQQRRAKSWSRVGVGISLASTALLIWGVLELASR
jgi:hypothetical protein